MAKIIDISKWQGNINWAKVATEDIGMANLAQMVNALAPIVTCGSRSWVQTTYHVLSLYRKNLQGRSVRCAFSAPSCASLPAGSLSVLDASACLRSDGTICLFLVNLSQDASLEVALPQAWTVAESTVLSAPSFTSANTPDTETVTCRTTAHPSGKLILPAASVTAAILAS